MNEIEGKIEQGLGLSPLFEDLKRLQHKIKNIHFTKDDRKEIWDKIDGAFKIIKEKEVPNMKLMYLRVPPDYKKIRRIDRCDSENAEINPN